MSNELVYPMADCVETEKGRTMARKMWEEMKEELKAWLDVEGVIEKIE